MHRRLAVVALCGSLIVAACGGGSPGATIDVIPATGPDRVQAHAEVQATAERIALALGFEPSTNTDAVGRFYDTAGETTLILSVFQFREDPQIKLFISQHNYVMLGVELWDLNGSGLYFEDQSIAKRKLLELVGELRKEFGTDRIYLNDWTLQQMQSNSGDMIIP